MGTEVRRVCGARLRALRESKGLSQAELGAKVGVNQPAVWKWEAGKFEPSLETRHLIAAALGEDPYAIEVAAEEVAS
jgi:transcriptional regulator with XRE-family HTH domain